MNIGDGLNKKVDISKNVGALSHPEYRLFEENSCKRRGLDRETSAPDEALEYSKEFIELLDSLMMLWLRNRHGVRWAET